MPNLQVLFSPEDADLASVTWTSNVDGYARKSKRFAHRIVLSRILGRPLTSADICDHVNRLRTDNRRENLRLTNRAGNAQNRCGNHSSSSGGIRGVTWAKKENKWQVAVKKSDKQFWCGYFTDLDEASRAAAAKRCELGFLNDEAR